MNDSPFQLCRAAVAQCIDHYGLDDHDPNVTKRRLWQLAQRVCAGLPIEGLPEGMQYEVESTLAASDARGGWVALAVVLLNCQETMRPAVR